MSLKQELDVDIIKFLDHIEDQNMNDKVDTLRLLFDKYIHLSTAECLLDMHDLRSIITSSKGDMATRKMPNFLGRKLKVQLTTDEDISACIAEATISLLNKKDCLKKLPKFDYVENKNS